MAVTDSSRSAAAVTRAMTRTITHVDTDNKTLTLAGGVADIHVNDPITVSRGTESKTAVTVATVSQPDQIVLNQALPSTTDFTGGFIQGQFPLGSWWRARASPL